MGWFRRLRNVSLAAALFLPVSAFAVDLPAGTEIQIRLKTKVSTQSSKPQDPVDAVVIAPVMSGSQFVIPAGAEVHGVVQTATQSSKPDERSVLALSFTQIAAGAAKAKLACQLAGIDNAREKVDDQGQINGILASETITGKIDAGLDKIAGKYSGLAGVLREAKNAVLKAAEGDITYDSGVEMTLRLTAPLSWAGPTGRSTTGRLQPVRNHAALAALVAREPFQTMAENPTKPSDITNLMLVGSEVQVKQIFESAGWFTAQKLSAVAKFETVKALAEDRGYNEAPVSVLLLDGKPPDLVFEKLNNTFARRHHLRIWARPATFQGMPVWAVAATHDIGISFSEENRTFIHRIDSSIDTERAKVVNDLLFTGRVQSLEMIDRPNVPKDGENATGDKLATDGKIAVLVLN